MAIDSVYFMHLHATSCHFKKVLVANHCPITSTWPCEHDEESPDTPPPGADGGTSARYSRNPRPPGLQHNWFLQNGSRNLCPAWCRYTLTVPNENLLSRIGNHIVVINCIACCFWHTKTSKSSQISQNPCNPSFLDEFSLEFPMDFSKLQWTPPRCPLRRTAGRWPSTPGRAAGRRARLRRQTSACSSGPHRRWCHYWFY